jgi:hypothetical protein
MCFGGGGGGSAPPPQPPPSAAAQAELERRQRALANQKTMYDGSDKPVTIDEATGTDQLGKTKVTA